MNKIEIKDQDGDGVIVKDTLWIAVKSADSYYSRSIPSQYKNGMHDTRGLLRVFKSEEEARKWFLAEMINDLDLHWEDDAIVAERTEDGQDVTGYEGPGYYQGRCDGWGKVDETETSYEHDSRYYSIIPAHKELEEMVESGCLFALAREIESCGGDIEFVESEQ